MSRKNGLVSKINDVLATRITMLVGSIWAFYAFVIFGLTPLLWPHYEQQILYWSNFLQLVFLPVITVGTAIMSRGIEERAVEDHKTIRREFALVRDAHNLLHKSLNEIHAGVQELVEHRRAEVGTAEAKAVGTAGVDSSAETPTGQPRAVARGAA
jgi:hypothetical protein